LYFLKVYFSRFWHLEKIQHFRIWLQQSILWNLFFAKKIKLNIQFFKKYFFYAFNTIMKRFFTIVYIRIISLRWKFDDHPLVEYPLSCKKKHLYRFIFYKCWIFSKFFLFFIEYFFFFCKMLLITLTYTMITGT
jgi:hypothetical protein